MQKPVITLTSDLGDRFANSQIELVVDSINPKIKFIVAEHKVTPFSIIEGAFIISKFYSLSPKGSIHIGVVDPGVGSDRKGIIIRSTNHWFVGPDNGLLYPAAMQDGIQEVFQINEAVVESLSNTFHGRDIFAKIAAYISLGKSILKFTKPYSKTDVIKLSFILNQVVHIDSYGNVKLYAQPYDFELGDNIVVEIADKKIVAKYCKTFADVEPSQYLLYNGSHQTLELAINTGSAAAELGVKVEDILNFQKV
jgi:S-adenosylmethionine hydrolase